MGLMPDSSPYGSQTVTGPGWPNVDEEALAAAAAQYEELALKLTGSVVPQQQGQLMKLADTWKGGGALAAAGEATTIIGGHEANAAQAAAIAAKLRAMEVTVAKTKALVNATAMETQQECEAIQAMPISNTQELVQSRIKLGLSQNIAYVNANSTELAAGLGVPPNIPNPGAPPGTAQASQAADKGSQQAMQMMMQMGQMAAQLPQQIGGMLTQAPQQLDAAVATTRAAAAAAHVDVRRKGRYGWRRADTLLVLLQPPTGRRVRRERWWRHGARGIDARLWRSGVADPVDGEPDREPGGGGAGGRRYQQRGGRRRRAGDCRRRRDGRHGHDGSPRREWRDGVVAGDARAPRIRPGRRRRR